MTVHLWLIIKSGLRDVRDHVLVVLLAHGLVHIVADVLELGPPDLDDGLDAARGQEARVRMRLQAVHDRLVALQNAHNVGRVSIPDEYRTIVRTRTNKVPSK